MSVNTNPFEILTKKTKVQSEDIELLNEVIEDIFLFTVDKSIKERSNKSSRPKCLYYINEVVNDSFLTLDNVEQVIFDRLFSQINTDNVIHLKSGYDMNVDCVTDSNPINYLFNCFLRGLKIYNSCQSNMNQGFISANVDKILNEIIRQSKICIQNNFEISPKDLGTHLYNCFINNVGCDNEYIQYFKAMFKEFESDFQNDEITNYSLYFVDFFQFFLSQTLINKSSFSTNLLRVHKDPLQTLYCPERKQFVQIITILSNIPASAEMILDFSSQNIKNGKDFEKCLLGRFLVSTHLPTRMMESPEFFNKMPIPVQEKQLEEQNIWQLTKSSLSDTCDIFMNIFRCSTQRPNIKTKLLTWIGQCIHLNKGRNQLAHSLSGPLLTSNELASDGFFMNFTYILFHIANPLIEYPFAKIFSIQLEFTEHKEFNETLLSGLYEETRLIPMDDEIRTQIKFSDKYTVLTQLFFLVQKAFQLSFHVIQAKFMELNQQLHRIQDVYQDLLNNGMPNSPDSEALKRMMTSQMGQYLSMSCSLRNPDFMMKAFGLIVASSQLLVKIVESENKTDILKKISCIPEFVMDNIVDFLTFLRHFDDAYFETSGYNLDSLLKMIVLYMGSTNRLKNPHLRSKVATLLECLIPQRDELSTQSGPITFYMREQLFQEKDNGIHDFIIEALFSAFTTMELSVGQENVRFEEKFEYRRPMYACMRFFYNKPKFDDQIRRLEKLALENINDVEAPLCLKFLNLLINDATYLLDEALNYLGQLKAKELERMTQGGKFQNQTEEGSFQHMVMLAKYHNTLASDTIDQLSRMASLCPNIMTHPILIDRIACTLNYFLDHLVGPKRSNLTVIDKEAYAFRPKQLVRIIAKIYVSLGDIPEFCEAVVNDGRSYSDKLLETASSIISKVSTDIDLLSKFEDLTKQLKICAENQNEENENFEDAPEEYLDPIMGTVMRDPVILPSSGKNVDRKTIFRHLLSDPTDPFNRQPLAMSDVKPNEELKRKVFEWIEGQRH